jgi:flagellar hook-basal body complex protein FliE
MGLKSVSQLSHMIQNDKNVKSWSNKAEKNLELGLPQNIEQMSGSKGVETFGDFLTNSLAEVNKLQVTANEAVQKLASGESKNVHETLLAVERADIAFRTLNQIRGKVIDAYKEIMRMQV